MDVDSEDDDETDDENDKSKNRNVDLMTTPPSVKNSEVPPAVRPQIIVTPRKVAAAIESVTAAVLAKNNKSSLSECVKPEIPITLLPSSFPDIENRNLSSSDVSGANKTEEPAPEIIITTAKSSSPSKSVIVRAGPSVRLKQNKNYLHRQMIQNWN